VLFRSYFDIGSKTALHNIIKGKNNFSLRNLKKISDKLDLSPIEKSHLFDLACAGLPVEENEDSEDKVSRNTIVQ
jgi:hypothetical protein